MQTVARRSYRPRSPVRVWPVPESSPREQLVAPGWSWVAPRGCDASDHQRLPTHAPIPSSLAGVRDASLQHIHRRMGAGRPSHPPISRVSTRLEVAAARSPVGRWVLVGMRERPQRLEAVQPGRRFWWASSARARGAHTHPPPGWFSPRSPPSAGGPQDHQHSGDPLALLARAGPARFWRLRRWRPTSSRAKA
jgi:hypothetical protein